MKKIICLLLGLSFVLTGCDKRETQPEEEVVYQFVREGKDGDNISWGLTADGILVISGKGEMIDHGIDQELAEEGIDAIDTPWYYLDVTSVVIQKGVTRIGALAFAHLGSLEKVTIGEDVAAIGIGAFYYSPALKSVAIPDLVATISPSTFEGCMALEEVDFGTGVTEIGAQAFYGCASLKNAELPDALVTIGNRAFLGCAALESVTFGSGLLNIGTGNEMKLGGVFERCTSLTSIVIPNSVTIVPRAAFMGCTALTNVTIGSGVTNIDANAFYGCSSLASITIPRQVEIIDVYAFIDCPALADVTVMRTTPPELWQDYPYASFDRADDTLHVPAGSVAAYQAHADWNEAFANIVEQK